MPKSTVNARIFAVAWRSIAALLLMSFLLIGVGLVEIPLLLFFYYLAAGFVSFIVYGLDKRAAIRGEWRTSEATLQSIDLAGGIVGGLLAQLAFRHKIAKPEFGAGSALIVLVHACGLGAVLAGFVNLPQLG